MSRVPLRGVQDVPLRRGEDVPPRPWVRVHGVPPILRVPWLHSYTLRGYCRPGKKNMFDHLKVIYTSVRIRDFWTVTFEHTNLRLSAHSSLRWRHFVSAYLLSQDPLLRHLSLYALDHLNIKIGLYFKSRLLCWEDCECRLFCCTLFNLLPLI